MYLITTRQSMIEFAREQGVRADWHEPDEQNLTAVVKGWDFDNAGFWGDPKFSDTNIRNCELHVLFYKTEYDELTGQTERVGAPIAAVNLATLCAWATGHNS